MRYSYFSVYLFSFPSFHSVIYENFFPLISHLSLIRNCFGLDVCFTMAISVFADQQSRNGRQLMKRNQGNHIGFLLPAPFIIFTASFHRRFSLGFCKIWRYRLWPFFKADSCPGQSKREHEHEEDLYRPEKTVEIKTSIFPAVLCKSQINHSS